MKIKHKNFKIKVDGLDEKTGEFEGYLSIFDNIDSYNERVKKGAFLKTLKENDSFPLLYQHDSRTPVGHFHGEEDRRGLKISGELNLEKSEEGNFMVPDAFRTYALWKKKDINGLSIGYDVVKDSTKKEGDRRITELLELKLWEGSVVTFPANTEATITAVKSIEEIKEQIKRMLFEYKGNQAMLEYIKSLFHIEEPANVTPEILEVIEKPAKMFEGHAKRMRNLLQKE